MNRHFEPRRRRVWASCDRGRRRPLGSVQPGCVGTMRGSPNCRNALLSATKVISAMLLPARVRTINP